jgi:two-component system nitrogen regulation response regulator NtrX
MDPIEVLLVDDEADYAETMAFWLKAKGYKVTTASNGEEALSQLKAKIPRIVFLDILMPGMDGIETLRRIRENHPDLPVIMVTAYASEDKMQIATALGAVGFFPKAADFSQAAKLIDQALRGMKQAG